MIISWDGCFLNNYEKSTSYSVLSKKTQTPDSRDQSWLDHSSPGSWARVTKKAFLPSKMKGTKPFLVCLGMGQKFGIVSQTSLFSIDISPMFDPALWEKIQNCPQILSLTGKIIRNDEQSSYRETYFLWTSNTRQLCHMRSIIHHSDTGIWKRSNKQHHLVMFAISLLLVSLVAYSSSASQPKITVPWKMGMKEFTKCVAPGKLYASVVGQGWYQNRNKFTNVSELI